MLVIAHRTCPRDAPENSLAGIRHAARAGADAVEVDVRLTSDGVPVLHHDAGLLRMTFLPLPVRLTRAAWATRLRLRGGRERVPTFVEALQLLEALPGLRMAVDVKDPRAHGKTLEAVRDVGMLDRVLLWSQHRPCVEYFAEHCPGSEVALLRDTADVASTIRLFDEAVALGARAVSIHWSMVDAAVLGEANARRLAVYSWCKKVADFPAKARLPLAGVVTDWPGATRKMLPIA